MIKNTSLTIFILSMLVLSGCAQTNKQTDSGSGSNAADTERVSVPIPADSLFANISEGMADETVRTLIGHPDRVTSYKTGKSWIPFAGRWLNDVRRQSWFYKNLGVVVFTKNKYSGQYKVLRIDYNATQTLP